MSPSLLNDEVFSLLKERCQLFYGLDQQCWRPYLLIARKSSLWLCPSLDFDYLTVPHECTDTAGVRLFSGERMPYKPRLNFFQLFHREIDKGFIELNDNQAHLFLHRHDVETDRDLERGYLGVKNRGRYIGVGLGRGHTLVSQVPKRISAQLKKTKI